MSWHIRSQGSVSVSVFNSEWTGYRERLGFLKQAADSRCLSCCSRLPVQMPAGHQLAGRLSPFAKGSTLPLFLLPHDMA